MTNLDYETIFQAIKQELDYPKMVDSMKVTSWLKIHCIGLSFEDREKLMFKLRQDLWEA